MAYLLQGKGITIFIAICIDELQGCKIESKSFFFFFFLIFLHMIYWLVVFLLYIV